MLLTLSDFISILLTFNTMSDGPHKSLNMRPGWKRTAKCADNATFEVADVAAAVAHALEQDCRGELSSEFISSLKQACGEGQSSLFGNDIQPRLERLRNNADIGMARLVVDYAIHATAEGCDTADIPRKALSDALKDRGARGARQVEEHYYRQTNQPRASRVRERVEQAVQNSNLDVVADRVLNRAAERTKESPLQHRNLDDGVKIK